MFECNFLNSNKMVLNKLVTDFSGFSKLGDLSKYSCDELMDLIQDMDVKISHEDVYKCVTWENNHLAITVCFNSSDEFMHIEREVWKDLDVDIFYAEEDWNLFFNGIKCHPAGGILCLRGLMRFVILSVFDEFSILFFTLEKRLLMKWVIVIKSCFHFDPFDGFEMIKIKLVTLCLK